jgi:hypothetical protein
MGNSLTPVGKKKIRIPVHQHVRFELLNHERLILRKQVQVLVGPNEVAEVDVALDMGLRDWKRLKKAIRKARDRKAEKHHRRMSTIRRPPVNPSPFTASITARQGDEPVL